MPLLAGAVKGMVVPQPPVGLFSCLPGSRCLPQSLHIESGPCLSPLNQQSTPASGEGSWAGLAVFPMPRSVPQKLLRPHSLVVRGSRSNVAEGRGNHVQAQTPHTAATPQGQALYWDRGAQAGHCPGLSHGSPCIVPIIQVRKQ